MSKTSEFILLTVKSVAVLSAMLWLVGCGERTSTEPRPTQPIGGRIEPTTRGDDQHPRDDLAVRSLVLGGEQRTAQLDTNSWASERFSRQCDEQLQRIAALFASKHRIDEQQLAACVVDGFRGVVPHADAFVEVYRHDSLSVRRADTRDKSLRLSGPGDFAEWLNSMSLEHEIRREAHLKFKTFGVELQPDHGLTTVWMHMDQRSGSDSSEYSAIWRCRWQTAPDGPTLEALEVNDMENVRLESSQTWFADCTESILGHNRSYHDQLAYGLNHWLDRLELYDGIVATSYHGLAVGDVNNDGLDDLYLCQPGGASGGLPNRLFLQQGDGRAHDVSADSGTDWLLETHSALLIDLDNDGDQDLVAATMAGLIFAENDGQARFQPKLHKLMPEAPPISLAAADYDLDGDLDIYACCYGRRAAEELMGRPIPYHDANNGARNALLRNDRDWRFTNVTKQVGLEHNNRRFSLACAWEDFDNDGDQDLYVANDFGRNSLYRNDGGQFVDVATTANVEDMSAGMSVSWSDFDNDGRMDLYVSNMWSSAGNRIAYQRQFLPANDSVATLAGFQRHARGNSLFRNESSSNKVIFSDVSQAAHVTIGGWAWSSNFLDINNDGWEDLVVANGYITQKDPHDL